MFPSSPEAKVFTILFVLYGVGILGFFLGIIGIDIFEAQKAALEETTARSQKRIIHMFSRGENHGTGDGENPPPGYWDEAPKAKTLWEDIKEIMWLEAPIFAVITVVTVVIARFEGWSIIDSVYYCLITLSTVGYGDLHPDTNASMLVSIFYLPLAVAVFGEVLARIAGTYIHRKARKVDEAFLQRELTFSDLRMMDDNFDDKVELWEFLSFMLVAMQKVDKKSIDELKALFYSLDANGTGALEKADLILLAQRKRERMLGRTSSQSSNPRRSLHSRSYTR